MVLEMESRHEGEDVGGLGSSDRLSPLRGRCPRGPTAIDLPGTGYSADVYQKYSYKAERLALAEKTEILIARARLWTPETARKIIATDLDRSDPNNTSWIGFRKSDAPRGEYCGAAWQEEVTIPTPQGDRKQLYMLMRVFEPVAQGLHLGRTAMQVGLTAHPDVDSIGHRSASARAVHAFLESGVFKPGRRFPYDIPFSSDPSVAYILLWIWQIYHLNGKIPDLEKGVSRNDYLEPNGADPEDERYPAVMQKRRWMKEVLEMGPLDALYEVGEVA